VRLGLAAQVAGQCLRRVARVSMGCEEGRTTYQGRVDIGRGGGENREADLPLSQSIKDSLLDPISVIIKTHMLQHHHAAQQQRSRVRKGLAGNIRGGAVNSLEDRALVADIARGRKAKAADKAGAHIGENIAVEVRHDEDLIVVRGGIGDDLQTRVIEQLGVELDVWEVLANLAGDAEE